MPRSWCHATESRRHRVPRNMRRNTWIEMPVYYRLVGATFGCALKTSPQGGEEEGRNRIRWSDRCCTSRNENEPCSWHGLLKHVISFSFYITNPPSDIMRQQCSTICTVSCPALCVHWCESDLGTFKTALVYVRCKGAIHLVTLPLLD